MKYSEIKKAIKLSDTDIVREVLHLDGEDVLLSAMACDVAIEDIAEAYQGNYASDEDFVQGVLDSLGTIPKDLPSYIHIDWEATAHDIMMDYSKDNGHYFRNL